MTRRTVVLGGAGVAGAALSPLGIPLVGCGVEGGGTGSTASKRPATLQYWSRWPGGAHNEVEEKAVPTFMAKQPHIKVERTGVTGSYDNLLEKITTAFASGTAPDVFTMGSSGIATYAHPGHVLQLDNIQRLKKDVDDFFGPPRRSVSTRASSTA